MTTTPLLNELGNDPGFCPPKKLDVPADLESLFPIMGSLRRAPNIRELQGVCHDLLVLGRIHLTTSAIAAVDILLAAGVVPTRILLIAKNYDYAYRDFVQSQLSARNIRVISDEDLQAGAIFQVEDMIASLSPLRILTVEDGGELLSVIQDRPLLAEHWIGGVEQTTRGLRRIELIKPQRPIVALPTSKIKAEFEAPHIAVSGIQALRNFFPHDCLADWTIAVLGLGQIGKHFLIALDDVGCEIRGFDPDPVQRLKSTNIRGKAITTSSADAVRGADLIVGTSGKLSIGADVIAESAPHARIGSLSSERVEVDVNYLEQISGHQRPLLQHPEYFSTNRRIGTRYILANGRQVDLLCEGRPLNFSEQGVLCEKHADLIVGWLVLCGLAVASGQFKGQAGILSEAADAVFQRHELARIYERSWR